ncbi:MAG: tetratricopeptide repeat protein [Comamonadaceae bacterium]|nr:tetratricopeptide repeat protein [Comamonadaceae bacterium]
MLDATDTTFQRDVIDASHQQPVLVDFWAPWCGPCRALGPLLEKLEAAYGGRFRLVKVNSDQHPALSAQFNVRSIPYVVAFIDGEPVNAFVGALPEGQLRAFVDALLPNPSEIERKKALELLAGGQTEAALLALRAALALNPANDAARWDLAELQLAQATKAAPDAAAPLVDDARTVLDAVAHTAQSEPRHRALFVRVQSLARAAALPQLTELQDRIAANGADLQARLDLANLQIARGDYEPALEQLLEIVARDRSFGDDIGRTTILSIFELMAGEPARVATYRRRLASALNR